MTMVLSEELNQTIAVMLADIEQLAVGGLARLQTIADALNALISPDPLRRDFFGHERLVATLYKAVKPDPVALEFASRVACLSTIAEAIRAKLEKLVALNRTRADFSEKFEDLIESYNAGSRTIEALYQELLNLSNSLSTEEQRHVRENLTEEELVIFDILTRPSPELGTDERAEVKKVARELLTRLKALLVLNWRQKSTARSQLKLAIEDALDSGLPRAYTPEIYQQKCSAVFEHVYESYPERNAGVYA